MASETILYFSVPNLKSFGALKTELNAKKDGEFSIMLYEKRAGGYAFSDQHHWLTQYEFMEII